MNIAVITLDNSGSALAGRIIQNLPRFMPEAETHSIREFRNTREGGLPEIFSAVWNEHDGLICIMASGIAVRMLAPLAQNKYTDPAVVVLDDAGRWAISLLSGHEGGANNLAWRTAAAAGALAVITTGSETKRRYTLGLGCRKGIEKEAVKEAVNAVLGSRSLRVSDIRCAATVRLKDRERGLIQACNDLQLALMFVPEDAINMFDGPYARNEISMRRLGLRAVAEPCALLASRGGKLIIPKTCRNGVSAALAEESA